MSPIRVFATIMAIATLASGLAVAEPTRALARSPDDMLATSNGAVDVHIIHHAALTLAWKGVHVLADPGPNPMAPQGTDPAIEYGKMPTPDIILITHIHPDHFNVSILQATTGPRTIIIVPENVHNAMPANLQAKSSVMKNGDKATVDGILIEAVPMYNITPAREKLHPKGFGNGYVLTLGGKRVYIAGDTEEDPTLAHLANIDAAFIPMNLPYTETVQAAAKWVKDFRPKAVYPYHYLNRDGGFSDLEEFKKLVAGASDVRLRNWYPKPN